MSVCLWTSNQSSLVFLAHSCVKQETGFDICLPCFRDKKGSERIFTLQLYTFNKEERFDQYLLRVPFPHATVSTRPDLSWVSAVTQRKHYLIICWNSIQLNLLFSVTPLTLVIQRSTVIQVEVWDHISARQPQNLKEQIIWSHHRSDCGQLLIEVWVGVGRAREKREIFARQKLESKE